MKVSVKVLNKQAMIPTKNKVNSYDIYACMDTPFRTIDPGKTETITTGLQVIIPEGYAGYLMSRNGVATRRGLRMSSGSMLVESDLELVVSIYNDSNEKRTIENGHKIAKLILVKIADVEFEVEE
ncbi:MAG: dUTP diphosphatase [Lachnospiraceae bacterium]